MPIKMKLRDALPAHAAIQTLPNKLPVKVAYRLGRIGNFLRGEEREFHEQRNKLLREHGTRDGASYKLEGDGQAAFNDAVQELLDTDIEIPFDPVKLDDLVGADPAKAPDIEPAAFEALQPFIEE